MAITARVTISALTLLLAACAGPLGDAPGAPTDLRARSLDGGVVANWTHGAPGSGAVTNHAYSLDDGATWSSFSPAVAGGEGVIGGLTNGEVHRLRVRAVSASGTSQPSEAVDAVAAVPAFLTGLHGTGIEDEIRVKRLAPTRDGGVLVVGELSGSVAFGDLPFTSAPHSDVGYVGKLDADGAWAWRVDLNAGGSSWVEDVVPLPDGSAVVTGSFRTSLDLAAAGMHVMDAGSFVAGLDQDGSWTWSLVVERPGMSSALQVNSIAVLPDGDIALTGLYRGAIAFGSLTTPDSTTTDLFVARASPAGSWRWLQTAESDDSTTGGRVTVLMDGTIVVIGQSQATVPFDALPDVTVPAGQRHVVVAALASDGTWLWARTFGNQFSSSENSLVAIGDEVLAVGTFVGAVEFGPFGSLASPFGGEAAYLVRFGSDGGWRDVRVLAASDGGSAVAAAARPGGGVYLTGRLQGDVHLDGTSVAVAAGGPFVAAIDPSGMFLGWTELIEVHDDPMADSLSANVESDAIAIVGGLPAVAGYLNSGGMTNGESVVARDEIRDRDDAFVWKADHESTW